MDYRERLQTAVIELDQREAEEAIHSLLTGDIACSQGLRRLGEVLRAEEAHAQDQAEMPDLLSTVINTDELQENISRLNDMVEAMKDHGSWRQ